MSSWAGCKPSSEELWCGRRAGVGTLFDRMPATDENERSGRARCCDGPLNRRISALVRLRQLEATLVVLFHDPVEQPEGDLRRARPRIGFTQTAIDQSRESWRRVAEALERGAERKEIGCHGAWRAAHDLGRQIAVRAARRDASKRPRQAEIDD